MLNYVDWPYQVLGPKRKMTCSQLKILPRWHFLLSVSHSPFRCWQIWRTSWINRRLYISGDANHWRGTLSTGDRGGKINSKIDEKKLSITHLYWKLLALRREGENTKSSWNTLSGDDCSSRYRRRRQCQLWRICGYDLQRGGSKKNLDIYLHPYISCFYGF